ncbi:MAG: hypothetical protein RJB68_1459, partial [Pseudomonadota bacterium]
WPSNRMNADRWRAENKVDRSLNAFCPTSVFVNFMKGILGPQLRQTHAKGALRPPRFPYPGAFYFAALAAGAAAGAEVAGAAAGASVCIASAPCFSPLISISPPLLRMNSAKPANNAKPTAIFHIPLLSKKKPSGAESLEIAPAYPAGALTHFTRKNQSLA